ncbi:MAG: S8 family serine peptidase [Acidobacteriota bacterium]
MHPRRPRAPRASLVCLVLATLLVLFFTAPLGAQSTDAAVDWTAKVDPWVLDTAGESLSTEFLIVLDAQADLSGAQHLRGKQAKGRYVFAQLRRVAEATQGPILRQLAQADVEHRPYWVQNMIWARGDRALVQTLARRSDVARIAANPTVAFDGPVNRTPTGATPEGACPPTLEASLVHIGADDFWAQGITGAGVVIGGQDTGYDWDHPALRDAYRGWVDGDVDHNYHWHDAIRSGGGVCGADSPVPCDDNSHGTHTMGTMVGRTDTVAIGVAPDAKWIGCRNMDRGNGTPATYGECFEWFLAPTDVAGNNPNPDLAPHVINNSWGCPGFEGCTDPNVLRTAVENLRAAGVVVVVSAGNSGSSCSSVSTPAAIYDASFTVGAVSVPNDTIAGFSSRGPVTSDGSNRLKPDVSAPGVGICSSVPGTGYASFSGTSMAGPHVAGLVALLIQAAPCLEGDVDAIEAYLRDTAVTRTSTQTCGGVAGASIPNNTFGYGSVRAVMPPAGFCDTEVFRDGFESGDLSAWTTP